MNQSFDGDDVNIPMVADFEHRHVFALLPWWVNGTLTEQERVRVQHHAEQCAGCRREIHLLSAYDRVWREEPSPVSDVNHALASVMARIDGATAGVEPVGNPGRFRKSRNLPSLQPPESLRWMAAAAAVAVFALLLAPLRPDMSPEPHNTDYSVLSASEMGNSGFLLKVDLLEGTDAAAALPMLRHGLANPSVISEWTVKGETGGVLTIDGSVEPEELMSILGSLSRIDRVTHVEMLPNE